MRHVISTGSGDLVVGLVEHDGLAAVCIRKLGLGPERCVLVPTSYLPAVQSALAGIAEVVRGTARRARDDRVTISPRDRTGEGR